MDIKDSYLHGTVGVVKSISVDADKLTYKLADKDNTSVDVTMPTATQSANGLLSSTDKKKLDSITGPTLSIPYIVGPDTDTTAGTWTGSYSGITAYTDGLTIIYVPKVAGASTTTLNINGLGAKTCYYTGTSKLITHYAVGTPILLTYVGGYWKRADYHSWTPYVAAYCSTAATAAAKTASCNSYVLTSKTYIHILITTANTAQSALTMNINSTGAKPIYINGSASSTSNYTLPAGTYIVYYDGTNFYFRTDGMLPGKIEKAQLSDLVTCTAGSSDVYRPIVVYTSDTGKVYHNAKITANYVSGDLKATSFTGTFKGTADKVANSLILKINSGTTEGTSLYTYNGSAAKTLDIKNGTGIGFTNTAGVLSIYNSGVRSISTGSANGTISVNTNGASANVAVKGLGSAAYTNTNLYQKQSTYVNNTVEVDVYKKITITKSDLDGYGVWLHSRKQHYLLNSGAAAMSTPMNTFWELGTAYNASSKTRTISVKMIVPANSSNITLYVLVRAYTYIQVVTSGTVTISDSTSAEYEGITSSTTGWVACLTAQWTDTTYSVVSSSANGLAPKVINTNTATVGSAYYVLASTNGSATPSWYKLPTNAFANDDTKVTQTNTTDNAAYRVLLGNNNDTTETTTARKSANLLFNPSTGTLAATTFQGNLDGAYVNALTGYTKATSASDLAATDTLNTALGKLEYKADTAYDWVISVTTEDTDKYVNKWQEILDFLNKVDNTEGADITDEFVTRKTSQEITGNKYFNSDVSFGKTLKFTSVDYSDQIQIFAEESPTIATVSHLVFYASDDSSDGFVFRNKIYGTDTPYDVLKIAYRGITATSNITAPKFITSDGTSSQFVKGDGSLDSTSYVQLNTVSYTTEPVKGWHRIAESSGSQKFSITVHTKLSGQNNASFTINFYGSVGYGYNNGIVYQGPYTNTLDWTKVRILRKGNGSPNYYIEIYNNTGAAATLTINCDITKVTLYSKYTAGDIPSDYSNYEFGLKSGRFVFSGLDMYNLNEILTSNLTATKVTADGFISTSLADSFKEVAGHLTYESYIPSNAFDNTFNATGYNNSVLTLSRYESLGYASLLGFNGNGLFYRAFNNLDINSKLDWELVLTSGNYSSYLPFLNSTTTRATKDSVIYAPTTAGTSGLILTSTGSGTPVWSDYNSVLPVKLINDPGYTVLKLSYGLNSNYGTGDYGSPVEEYLVAFSKYLLDKAAGYTCIGYIRPNSRGSYICDIYNNGTNSTTGLPEHITGHYFSHRGTHYHFGTSYGVWYFYTALHSANYTTYTVTKTGGGASGTWGISITGNAGSASTSAKLSSTTVISDKALSLSNASWTDTGYTFESLASGTYAVQVTCGNLVASGIMSVYKNIDDTAGDEIPLHVYHDSTQPWRPYLRTSGKKLLISSNDGSATSRTVTIKIALIL